MTKYFLMILAFIVGTIATFGICWGLVAFICWEPDIAKWSSIGRFMLVVFGFTPAMITGVCAAAFVETVIELETK